MKHLEKFCKPSSLDKYPMGTTAKVIIDKDKNEYELYIQLSQEEDKADWQRLGVFFEQIFDEEFVSNSNFLEACLNLYKNLQESKLDHEYK